MPPRSDPEPQDPEKRPIGRLRPDGECARIFQSPQEYASEERTIFAAEYL